ncbi:MAG: DUF177 domain-containing protein [Clostridia bacterium]|nr:DUF177 domain-containing protein [Clostridia bacterium]
MNLDLRPMLRGETQRIELDILLEPEAPAGVEFEGQARLLGVITSNNVNGGAVNECGYMDLSAQAQVSYRGECARCLESVRGVFTLPFERVVVTEGTLSREEEEDNVDEYVVIKNGILDGEELSELVREAILLSFPMRLLCDEGCEGLCPTCGKPKREGACGCSTKTVDPRWAALASIKFDENGNMIAPEKKEK